MRVAVISNVIGMLGNVPEGVEERYGGIGNKKNSGSASGVMVIVAGNGYGDTSSNPEQD